MAQRIQVRRGTAAQLAAITPYAGEPCYTTDTKLAYIGDGSTAGGILIGGGSAGPTRYQLLTPSAVATATPTIASAQTTLEIVPTGTTYTYTLVLSTTDITAGATVRIRCDLAAVPAFTLDVRNATAGGTQLWSAIRATASDPALWAIFTYSGTAWRRIASGYEV